MIEFETMGAYIKVGEVSVNLGEILNEKKYRVVNAYPLGKCYDKSAKVKLAVDFVPETTGVERVNKGNVKFGSNVQSSSNMNITKNNTTKITTINPIKQQFP